MTKIISIIALFLAINLSNAQIKILFDATKAEMANNADWVIDADLHNLKANSSGAMVTGGSDSNPQRYPTPSQSGIVSSTLETYWTGALSAWAVDLVKLGYTVETLPYNGTISYGNFNNAQDLSQYNVFIIDEPNIKFTTAEADALINFVKNGGGLFMISDHTVSDRNSDGWDSPMIWNDILKNNTIQSNPFGITFDLANISQTTSNFAVLPNNSILHGTAGTPTKMQYSNGTTITIDKTINPSAEGLIFKTGSSTTGTTNAMFATATYGKGRVCALGDSSVPDDGTGDPGDSLYNGYTEDANGNHKPLLLNATIWLVNENKPLSTIDQNTDNSIEIYPNPTIDFVFIKSSKNNSSKTQFSITDMTGKVVNNGFVESNKIDLQKYPKGNYIISLQTKDGSKNFKVLKN